MRLAIEFLILNSLFTVVAYIAVLALIFLFSFLFWEWDIFQEFITSLAPLRFALVFSTIINIVYWFDEGYNDHLKREEKREQSVGNK